MKHSSAAWAAVSILLLASSAATAQQTDTRTGLDAIDLFDLAAKNTREKRFAVADRLYDALAENSDPEVRAEARFRKGQSLVARGRLRDAAVLYRRLLDEKPKAARVRLELAQILTRLGDNANAQRELRQAQAIGLPPDIAAQVNQASRSLHMPRRTGASFDISIAPDTNINRATQARILDTVIAPLDLSADARAQSGTGVKLFGQGFANIALTDQFDVVFRANALASLYRSAVFNDMSLAVLGGVEWHLPADRVTLAGNATKRWFGGRTYADSRSLSLDWHHQLGQQAQLTTSLSVGRAQFPGNNLQNGKLIDGSIVIEKALGARSGVAFGVTATRQTAADPSYASTTFGPTAYAWREVGQTTLFLATTSRRLTGDARNFLFLEKRREWLATFRAGATFRQLSFFGLSPILRVGLERNKSSIAIYDYHRKFAELGITRSF